MKTYIHFENNVEVRLTGRIAKPPLTQSKTRYRRAENNSLYEITPVCGLAEKWTKFVPMSDLMEIIEIEPK